MRIQNMKSKVFSLIFAYGILAISTFAQHGGQDTENVSKYKTPQMVSFIEEAINYLKSIDNPNERHLLKLSKCQSIFNTGQKLVRGGEIIALKTCGSLLRKGRYDQVLIKKDVKEGNFINQKEYLNKTTSVKSTFKEKVKKETNDFIKKEPEKSLDNDLLFF